MRLPGGPRGGIFCRLILGVTKTGQTQGLPLRLYKHIAPGKKMPGHFRIRARARERARARKKRSLLAGGLIHDGSTLALDTPIC